MPSWKVSNRSSLTNRPAWNVGAPGPSVGVTSAGARAIQRNANGQGEFRFRTFCTNQLGNIGGGLNNSMFGSSADGTNGCKDQPCVAPPYCNYGYKPPSGRPHSGCHPAKPSHQSPPEPEQHFLFQVIF